MNISKEVRYNDLAIDFKYLLVNRRDKLYGLTVNSVGFQPIRPNSEYPPTEHPKSYFFSPQKGRILPGYHILYISKGEGTFESEHTKRTRIKKGDAVILFPGQWHSYCPNKKTGWSEYYIGFEGELIDNITNNNFISLKDQIFNVGIVEELVQQYSLAIKIAKDNKSFAQQYLAGIVMNILGMVLSISQNRTFETNESAEIIEHAKIIMIENIHGEMDVQEIARKLSVSYSWFRRVFKEYTGFAPSQYIQEMKLRKAKELLAESNSSIKEISYELNFSSYEFFLSFFRKRVGITPTEYRNLGKV